ncbi:MAG: HAD family hydrolase [Dehalococcoidia bacterium]|nr:HAD family hydrolase [Dehalococcoidia bacterium]
MPRRSVDRRLRSAALRGAESDAGVDVRLDGLIFDVDGTVADNLLQVFNAFRAGFAAGGAGHYSDEDIFGLFGPSPEEIFQRAMPSQWQHAIKQCYQHYQASVSAQTIVVPALADALATAAGAGVRLGVVSGGSHRLVALTLEALDLQGRFADILANAVPAVPKRDHLARMAGLWKLAPHRLAYVGDSPNDMTHARDAGMTPLGAAWARESRPGALRRAGAAAVFTHPGELLAWLAGETSV